MSLLDIITYLLSIISSRKYLIKTLSLKCFRSFEKILLALKSLSNSNLGHWRLLSLSSVRFVSEVPHYLNSTKKRFGVYLWLTMIVMICGRWLPKLLPGESSWAIATPSPAVIMTRTRDGLKRFLPAELSTSPNTEHVGLREVAFKARS